jgi:hypothetical protein
LIEVVEIIGVDKNIIINALDSKTNDFEDAIQICASELNGIEIIITRNKSDFTDLSIKIMTPKEFFKKQNQEIKPILKIMVQTMNEII